MFNDMNVKPKVGYETHLRKGVKGVDSLFLVVWFSFPIEIMLLFKRVFNIFLRLKERSI